MRDNSGPCGVLDKPVREIMSTPVIAASEQDRLLDAVKEMYKSNVGSVVVMGREGISGILTRKDLVYLIAGGILEKNPRLGDVMSTSIVVASLNDTIGDVARRMNETGVRHIPILRDGEVVGIVSMTDIARRITEALLYECKP
ncbi:MAG: CBS domain-containing protein [Desulfurococcales archaeon]|nr:CBS domain-containing protein [Desulfurococcales archaeon]